MTHIVPARQYLLVFAALIGLTTATVAVSYIELGELNLIIAIAIATLKAMLVAWYFMHLKNATSLTRLVGVSGLAWLGILLTYTLSDVFTRQWAGR